MLSEATMISFSSFGPAMVTSGKPNYRLGMGRRLTVVSAISLSLLLVLALVFGRCGRYGICHGYRGVVHHRKSASLTPPSSPRKQRSHLKDVEKVLLVVQYPVVNDNLTVLLNSHPNLAIAYNTQLLDKVASVLYSDTQQASQSLSNMEEDLSVDIVINQLYEQGPLSTQFEQKSVKVIGDSSGFTLQELDSSRFQKRFESHLKTLSNLFHLPISVLFVNTAPLEDSGSKQLAKLDKLEDIVARTSNVSVLSLELQGLSSHSFMDRVCTFLGLSCSLTDVS